MEISFDPVKNRRNIVERGLGFSRAAEMDLKRPYFLLTSEKITAKFAISSLDTW